MQRYFVDAPVSGDSALLAGAEAHHLLHVMRAQPGLEVTLFDGSGAEFAAIVRQTGRKEVELEIKERREVNLELPFSLVLAVALPKGDRQRWLLEKATELGAAKLVPIETERSVSFPAAKLERYVIEACKQCGRNKLMEISPVAPWSEYLQTMPAASTCLLADPLAKQTTAECGEAIQASTIIQIAVGPEGGFTENEVNQAVSAGWQGVSLGRSILRTETAALALAAQVCGMRACSM